MGRVKIQIKRIQETTSRQVTFCKRRMGLLKKAQELSILCGADVALIIVSSTGRLYDFASPKSMEHILDAYNAARDRPDHDCPADSSYPLEVDEMNNIFDTEDHIIARSTASTSNISTLKTEFEMLSKQIRIRDGDAEELKHLSWKELCHLEDQIEQGLQNITQRRYELGSQQQALQGAGLSNVCKYLLGTKQQALQGGRQQNNVCKGSIVNPTSNNDHSMPRGSVELLLDEAAATSSSFTPNSLLSYNDTDQESSANSSSPDVELRL